MCSCTHRDTIKLNLNHIYTDKYAHIKMKRTTNQIYLFIKASTGQQMFIENLPSKKKKRLKSSHKRFLDSIKDREVK